jgi:endoglucanase
MPKSRPHFPWTAAYMLSLWAVLHLSACSQAPAPDAIPSPLAPSLQQRTDVEGSTPTSQTDREELPGEDKWELWRGGTTLRGANIWQRIVVPELDGGEFLGSGYIGPPYAQEDFDRLASLGANYVNISGPGLFTEEPPYQLDPEVQKNLDELLDMIFRADMFAVISFRTGPGRSDFTFYRDGSGDWFDPDLLREWVWEDLQAQDAWVEMWAYTAERYRDYPVVAGYDLMCEPNAAGIREIYDPEDFYREYRGTSLDWNIFYPRLLEAIRQQDPYTPVLVGGMGWSSLDWLPFLEPTTGTRVVYTFHQYQPQDQYTHQEIFPALHSYPGRFDLDWDGSPEDFDQAWLEGYFQIIGRFQEECGCPVAVNEYGVNRWVPGAADFLRDQIALFEVYRLNHAIWVWDPGWQPWTDEVNAMNYRFGENPLNRKDQLPNPLLEVLQEDWKLNAIRPSNFYSD